MTCSNAKDEPNWPTHCLPIVDHEQQSSFSQTRAASVYRRLIAFNPLISAILVNGPILGASPTLGSHAADQLP